MLRVGGQFYRCGGYNKKDEEVLFELSARPAPPVVDVRTNNILFVHTAPLTYTEPPLLSDTMG